MNKDFWLDGIVQRVWEPPTHSNKPEEMTLEEKMNYLTVLIVIIFVILLIFVKDHRISLGFLVLGLITIICVYYNAKKQEQTQENFDPDCANYNSTITPNSAFTVQYNNPTSRRFTRTRDLEKSINSQEWVSANQLLVGGVNPKSNIQPVIVPPSTDLDYWKNNNNVVHSAINDERMIDIYTSGYYTEDNCQKQQSSYLREDYAPTPKHDNVADNNAYIIENNRNEINTMCGYNPSQNKNASLPVNLPVGNCTKSPYLKQYNDNMYTQTIQPGLYSKSNISEPIIGNMGISFTQQIPQTTFDNNTYVEHDPISDVIEPVKKPSLETVNESNVYDPRFSGYGTSYRSFIDNVTGQPRFFYDDVNAVRMPNYIVKSAIDTQSFGDTYGSDGPNPNHQDIKQLANQAFTDNAIQFRTEMSQRLMRKVNSEQSQRRMAPKHTNGIRSLGSMGI